MRSRSAASRSAVCCNSRRRPVSSSSARWVQWSLWISGVVSSNVKNTCNAIKRKLIQYLLLSLSLQPCVCLFLLCHDLIRHQHMYNKHFRFQHAPNVHTSDIEPMRESMYTCAQGEFACTNLHRVNLRRSTMHARGHACMSRLTAVAAASILS